MKIEDRWKDGYLYYIEFRAQITSTEERVIRKNILLFDYYKKSELEIIVKDRFKAVNEVLAVDFVEESLVEK